jgi:hypothetical protein
MIMANFWLEPLHLALTEPRIFTNSFSAETAVRGRRSHESTSQPHAKFHRGVNPRIGGHGAKKSRYPTVSDGRDPLQRAHTRHGAVCRIKRATSRPARCRVPPGKASTAAPGGNLTMGKTKTALGRLAHRHGGRMPGIETFEP